MSRKVTVTKAAASRLTTLVRVLSLPADTRERVRTSLARLADFPDIGVPLPAPYDRHRLRFVLGPWRWMLIVYRVEESSGDIVVIAIEDARMSTSVTTRTR